MLGFLTTTLDANNHDIQPSNTRWSFPKTVAPQRMITRTGVACHGTPSAFVRLGKIFHSEKGAVEAISMEDKGNSGDPVVITREQCVERRATQCRCCWMTFLAFALILYAIYILLVAIDEFSMCWATGLLCIIIAFLLIAIALCEWANRWLLMEVDPMTSHSNTTSRVQETNERLELELVNISEPIAPSKPVISWCRSVDPPSKCTNDAGGFKPTHRASRLHEIHRVCLGLLMVIVYVTILIFAIFLLIHLTPSEEPRNNSKTSSTEPQYDCYIERNGVAHVLAGVVILLILCRLLSILASRMCRRMFWRWYLKPDQMVTESLDIKNELPPIVVSFHDTGVTTPGTSVVDWSRRPMPCQAGAKPKKRGCGTM